MMTDEYYLKLKILAFIEISLPPPWPHEPHVDLPASPQLRTGPLFQFSFFATMFFALSDGKRSEAASRTEGGGQSDLGGQGQEENRTLFAKSLVMHLCLIVPQLVMDLYFSRNKTYAYRKET